jgi:hypothetical protein
MKRTLDALAWLCMIGTAGLGVAIITTGIYSLFTLPELAFLRAIFGLIFCYLVWMALLMASMKRMGWL